MRSCGAAFRSGRRWMPLVVLAGVFLLLGVIDAAASDCSRDITRLRACLRTFGWATLFAGTTTTVVTVLVNGAEVVRVVKARGRGAANLEDSDHFVFDIRTEDRRSNLIADGEDMLWVFAEVLCNDPEMETGDITEAIEFTVEGTHADWVILGRPQVKGNMRAVRLKAQPPHGQAELVDEEITVVASASIDGKNYTGPVTLRLEEEPQMKITILE